MGIPNRSRTHERCCSCSMRFHAETEKIQHAADGAWAQDLAENGMHQRNNQRRSRVLEAHLDVGVRRGLDGATPRPSGLLGASSVGSSSLAALRGADLSAQLTSSTCWTTQEEWQLGNPGQLSLCADRGRRTTRVQPISSIVRSRRHHDRSADRKP